jgi:hypothetical protein
VVRCAVEGDSRVLESAKGIGESGPGGVENGDVVEARAAGRGRGSAATLPGVQAEVVVVAAGGDEGGGAAVALGKLEAEDAAVEGEGALEVGDFEVDMADAYAGMDGAPAMGSRLIGRRSYCLAANTEKRLSFPRMRESSAFAQFTLCGLWIPTFLGMTENRQSTSEVGFRVISSDVTF